MEASLAFKGLDLRDLYRRGSGMTLRRLFVLVTCLPPDAPLWAVLREEEEQAKKPTADRIRQRQREFEERNNRGRSDE